MVFDREVKLQQFCGHILFCLLKKDNSITFRDCGLIHSSNQNGHVDEEENVDDVTMLINDLVNPPPESIPDLCRVCGKQHLQKNFLTVHIDINRHEMQYECYICKQSFWLQCQLYDHMNSHTSRDVYPVREIPPHRRKPDTKQSGSEARKKKVGDSKRDKKDDGKDYNRKIKRSTASSKSSPISRRETKTYSCGECHRGFRKKYTLTLHLRTHSGEKPFGCAVCKKAFSQKHTLTEHRRIHNGKRPFTCDICEKTFRVRSHMQRHMNVHIPNNERIYKCKVCMKVFHQRRILSKHRKAHEEDN